HRDAAGGGSRWKQGQVKLEQPLKSDWPADVDCQGTAEIAGITRRKEGISDQRHRLRPGTGLPKRHRSEDPETLFQAVGHLVAFFRLLPPPRRNSRWPAVRPSKLQAQTNSVRYSTDEIPSRVT